MIRWRIDPCDICKKKENCPDRFSHKMIQQCCDFERKPTWLERFILWLERMVAILKTAKHFNDKGVHNLWFLVAPDEGRCLIWQCKGPIWWKPKIDKGSNKQTSYVQAGWLWSAVGYGWHKKEKKDTCRFSKVECNHDCSFCHEDLI